MVLDAKSLQEYPFTAGVPQGFILRHTLMTFLMMLSIILLYMLMIILFTLIVIRHLICGNQLELASELESDLRDTVNWDRKWLVDFSAGKNQLVWFDRFNNIGTIDVKKDGSVLEKKSSILGLTCSS